MKQEKYGEREYRAALDALRFSGEAKECMADRLMEQNGQKAGKRRTFRPLRAGLIAACLCLALVGTAFAVNAMTGFSLKETFFVERRNSEELKVKTVAGYTLDIGDRTYIPQSALSKEAQDHENRRKRFDSWEEGESYLGLNLADNPVLDQAAPSMTSVNGGDYSRIYVQYYGMSDKITIVEMSAIYDFARNGVEHGIRSDGMPYVTPNDWNDSIISVWVKANVYVEHYDKKWESPITHYYANATEVIQEDYVTPNGLETMILTISYPDSSSDGRPSCEYRAYFKLRGAEFSLWIPPVSDPDFALETLKTILDAYS